MSRVRSRRISWGWFGAVGAAIPLSGRTFPGGGLGGVLAVLLGALAQRAVFGIDDPSRTLAAAAAFVAAP